MAGSRQTEEREAAIAGHVFSHPLRVRILEVVNQVDMSPSQFLQSGAVPGDPPLSGVSYHFRELEKFGCLEIVKEIPKRGATEHVYRGRVSCYFSDEEWARLRGGQRRSISRTVLRGMVARVDGAVMAGTFDARLDRHLAWLPLNLDERGWDEMVVTLSKALAEAETIRRASEIRLAESGEDAIPATVGLLGFESPKEPVPLTP